MPTRPSTTNSSPARRPSTSPRASTPLRRWDNRRSTSSPTSWPNESLIDLKRLTLSTVTANGAAALLRLGDELLGGRDDRDSRRQTGQRVVSVLRIRGWAAQPRLQPLKRSASHAAAAISAQGNEARSRQQYVRAFHFDKITRDAVVLRSRSIGRLSNTLSAARVWKRQDRSSAAAECDAPLSPVSLRHEIPLCVLRVQPRYPARVRLARGPVGELIARRGITLVYGGGRVGLMGTLADAALHAGGRVVGVIPQMLIDREVGHAGLSQLHVVRTMSERKLLMGDLSDAFLALPGGIGTMDELFEAWTWTQLGLHRKPCALLNQDGYYDPLLMFLDRAVEQGFLQPRYRAALLVDADPEGALDRLAAAAP